MITAAASGASRLHHHCRDLSSRASELTVVGALPDDWGAAERASFAATMGWLWEVLGECGDEERLAFFNFVCGQRRVPAVPPYTAVLRS